MPKKPIPLAIDVHDVRIVRMDAHGSLDLETRTVDHPAAETTDTIEHGVPVADSAEREGCT